jgi:hypothetical protein
MGKQDVGRARQPKLVTRSLILEQAYEMYVRRELVQGDERLSLVLESLGYTTGAGYQIWPNQAAFRRDLQVYIAERLDYDSLLTCFVEVVDDVGQRDHATDAVEAMGERLARRLQDHEDFYLALRFLALGPDCPPEVAERMADGRSRVETALTAAFERLAAGRADELSRLRPGLLAVSVLALLEGFALRARVVPDSEGAPSPVGLALRSLFGVGVDEPAVV